MASARKTVPTSPTPAVAVRCEPPAEATRATAHAQRATGVTCSRPPMSLVDTSATRAPTGTRDSIPRTETDMNRLDIFLEYLEELIIIIAIVVAIFVIFLALGGNDNQPASYEYYEPLLYWVV